MNKPLVGAFLVLTLGPLCGCNELGLRTAEPPRSFEERSEAAPAPRPPPVTRPIELGLPSEVNDEAQTVETVVQRGSGAFVATPGTPTRASLITDAAGAITLNVVDAELREVVRLVLQDALGVNYVIDPTVGGRITVQTMRPLPADDLLTVLDTVLRMNGAAVLREGDLYRIVPIDQAIGAGPGVTVGPAPDAGNPGIRDPGRAAALCDGGRDGTRAGALHPVRRRDPGRPGPQSAGACRDAGSAAHAGRPGHDVRRRLAARHVVRAVSARRRAGRAAGRRDAADLPQPRGWPAGGSGQLHADRAAECDPGGGIAARLSRPGPGLDRPARSDRQWRGAQDLRLLGAERAGDQSRRGAERDVQRAILDRGRQQPARPRTGGRRHQQRLRARPPIRARPVVWRVVLHAAGRPGPRRHRASGPRRSRPARRTRRSASSPTTPATRWSSGPRRASTRRFARPSQTSISCRFRF